MNNNTRLVSGNELHEIVITEQVLNAKSTVWIATADLKDMHILKGRRFLPILDTFDELSEN